MAESEDHETPRKELQEMDARRVLAFFWPEIRENVDWKRDVDSLEQEFLPLAPQAAGKGRRLVDKLLKVYSKKGELRFLHPVIQARWERDFRWRIHTYNLRAEYRYGQAASSIIDSSGVRTDSAS